MTELTIVIQVEESNTGGGEACFLEPAAPHTEVRVTSVPKVFLDPLPTPKGFDEGRRNCVW